MGSLVGLGFSFFAYRQYFPPLTSPNSGIALSDGKLRGPLPMTGDVTDLDGDAEPNSTGGGISLGQDGDGDGRTGSF